MDAQTALAARQLARMRGMNARYHDRFFSDIRFSTFGVLALIVAGLVVDRWLFLAIPVVALLGAAQTAFDASYLIFSRQYATRLEKELNRLLGRDILIAHRLEDTYLFPLDDRKIVTLAGGRGFSWFGFMTAFYTILGMGSYAVGVGLSLDVIRDNGAILYGGIYLASLATLTAAALVVGFWWFVGGEGERRLKHVLDESFPTDANT
jgi:hypothetical protein